MDRGTERKTDGQKKILIDRLMTVKQPDNAQRERQT